MAEIKAGKEKIVVAFLILLGLSTVWLGFSGIGNRIQNPNGETKSAQNQKSDDIVADNSIDDILKLKNLDTDKDGLSDYDEINVYQTSVYLSDSDSDGFTDKEEVDSNNDPNCPKGGDCTVKADIIEDNKNNIDNIIPINNNGITPPVIDPNDPSAEAATKLFSGSLSASEIRNLLIQSGMNKSDLDQISDENIIQTYKEILANQGN